MFVCFAPIVPLPVKKFALPCAWICCLVDCFFVQDVSEYNQMRQVNCKCGEQVRSYPLSPVAHQCASPACSSSWPPWRMTDRSVCRRPSGHPRTPQTCCAHAQCSLLARWPARQKQTKNTSSKVTRGCGGRVGVQARNTVAWVRPSFLNVNIHTWRDQWYKGTGRISSKH